MKIGKQSCTIFAIIAPLFAAAMVCGATKPKATPIPKPKATPIPKPKGTPIPKPGDVVGNRKVNCVWICEYVSEWRPSGWGVKGDFGQGLTPPSSDETTRAAIVVTELTELSAADVNKIHTRDGAEVAPKVKREGIFDVYEKDRPHRPPVAVPEATDHGRGPPDLTVDGQWSYRASDLRYLMRDGRILRAGADITGNGPITGTTTLTRDDRVLWGSPNITGNGPSANFIIDHGTNNGKPTVRITVMVNADAGDKMTVTGKWHPLKNDPLHVKIDEEKWESGKFRPFLTGGDATNVDDPTKPLKMSYGWGSKTSDLYGTMYGQWTFTRTCDNSKTPPPNIYVPPFDLHNVPIHPGATPTPSGTPNSPSTFDSWMDTLIKSILSGGGVSPR